MKLKNKLTLSILPETLGICRFDRKSAIPDWAIQENRFSSIARTRDELSIICPEDNIPGGVLVERGWRAFKVEGPLGFVTTGIVSSLSEPLAEAEISILYISTYETDYILVKEENLNRAAKILGKFCVVKK
jgi:hypothetical protein